MKRCVLMVIDGLRSDHVTPELTPNLHRIVAQDQGRFFPNQRSVFPSATRISSASIATGCYPSSHGLAGNAIALDEGNGLQPVSVGPAEFRERWRRATGRTLLRPTLTERLSEHGGVSIYSNSSPGAAHMLDPDGHGWLRHRSGSHAPGFVPITGTGHLDVNYDAAGDTETIRRFCIALREEQTHPLHITWVCEPDHSQHALELGSPEHHEVIAGADHLAGQVAEAVANLRGTGEEVLFILASDHGHETVEAVVPITDLLVEAGFKADSTSSDVVLASSGMGASIYLSAEALERRSAITRWLRAQPWCAQAFEGEELDAVHVPRSHNLEIAFAMAKSDRSNRFGIPGSGFVAGDPFGTADQVGFGQHGGLGRYETNPMLVVSGGGFAHGHSTAATSTIDIAPTIMEFLGVATEKMDGTALPKN